MCCTVSFSGPQNEVSLLRNEVAHLKQLLLAHKDCPVTNLQKKNAYLGEPFIIPFMILTWWPALFIFLAPSQNLPRNNFNCRKMLFLYFVSIIYNCYLKVLPFKVLSPSND